MRRARPQLQFASVPVIEGWRLKGETAPILTSIIPDSVIPRALLASGAKIPTFIPPSQLVIRRTVADISTGVTALRLVDRSASIAPLHFAARCMSVTDLVLSGTPINAQFLAGVAEIECLPAKKATPLRLLDLGFCPNVEAQGLAFVARLTQLQHLRLNNCVNIRADALWFVGLMNNLRSLDLSWNAGVDALGLSYIRALPMLEALDLTHCNHVDGYALELLSATSSPSPLRELVLSRCRNVFTDGLSFVATMTSLTSLDVSHCPHVNGDGFECIARGLVVLKVLDASWCDRVDTRALSAIAEMQSLETLLLRYCVGVDARGLASVSAMPQLAELDVSGCPKIRLPREVSSSSMLQWLRSRRHFFAA